MGIKDFQLYADANWSSYRDTITNISKNDKCSLVKSDREIYNFDKINKDLYKSEKSEFASVDGIEITEKEVNLIEFKSGFKDKISLDSSNSRKSGCKMLNIAYDKYFKLFKKCRKLEKKGLINSLQSKAVESYITLEHKILPQIPMKISDININLIVVIDGNPSDGIENILTDLSTPKSKNESENIYQSVAKSLKKFRNHQDFSTDNYYFCYNSVNVVSASDYK